MKIIKPYMKMLTTGRVMPTEPKTIPNEIEPLDFVNWCGRISHRSEDAERQDVERFLRAVVLDHGDWSITEHVIVSVDAVVDRGITHELVRHRLAAYTQESTRFVNYNKGKNPGDPPTRPPAFIYPVVGVECAHCLEGGTELYADDDHGEYRHRVSYDSSMNYACAYDAYWLRSIEVAEWAYQQLVRSGWRPQEARSVFPNALASRIIITMNLRMWRHFFLMRTSVEAHPQMRQVTIPLLAEFQRAVPVLYEDITPMAKQNSNMQHAR